ncbi:hypothetical protein I302_107178 [Kwoniella bestiolae CBS 10118]|uniref:Uncharacterized protein n=1 Tax=Kwoniella bestiolae CBS 10118 TaxID=1296100 RepID=A0AAJ8KC37_9TREE
MRQLHIDEWQSTVLSQPVGLDLQRYFDRSTSLKIHKNWSFSGQDYTIKDEDGNVLLKSHGTISVFRQYIIKRTFNVYTPHCREKVFEVSTEYNFSPEPHEQGRMGSRTRFQDCLTGMNKQIVVDWNEICKKRGLISLRDDCRHDGTNDKMYGKGVPIGWLNDYETSFDIVHVLTSPFGLETATNTVDMTANVDYALLELTAICSESLTE